MTTKSLLSCSVKTIFNQLSHQANDIFYMSWLTKIFR